MDFKINNLFPKCVVFFFFTSWLLELFPILQHQRRFLERIQRSEAFGYNVNNKAGDEDGRCDSDDGPSPKKLRGVRRNQRRPKAESVGPVRGRYRGNSGRNLRQYTLAALAERKMKNFRSAKSLSEQQKFGKLHR